MGLFLLTGVVHTSRDELGKVKHVVKGTKKKEPREEIHGALSKNTCIQKASYTHIFLLKPSAMVGIGPEEVSVVWPL